MKLLCFFIKLYSIVNYEIKLNQIDLIIEIESNRWFLFNSLDCDTLEWSSFFLLARATKSAQTHPRGPPLFN